MRDKLLSATLRVVVLMSLVAMGMSAAEKFVAGSGPTAGDDQQYAGTWVGTYNSEGGSGGNVTLTLKQDEKAQWHGTVKYTDQDGAQLAELRSLQIAGGKFKAKIDAADPATEVTLEGEFQGAKFEGTYTVSEKGSTEILERGTWKATRS